jgi:hypothetical protein
MSSQTFLPDIQWIAKKATDDPKCVFQRLAHHLDEALLEEAFHRLRKDAAPGIDGQTVAEYAEGLTDNLSDLHERLRTQTYRATPIKRTWIPKRCEKYGLRVHPEKTRLVRFVRPKYGAKKDRTNGTFDFLGFTHYLAKSRRGDWIVNRRTSRKRLQRAISRYAQWCKFNRHLPVKEQWEKLSQKLKGYYQYFGIRGNYDSIYWVYYSLRFAWRRWLGRRSQKGGVSWDTFEKILARFPLPKPRIVQTWV